MAARNGGLPTRPQLSLRVSSLVAHHTGHREDTPSVVFASEQELKGPTSSELPEREDAGGMTLDQLEQHCDALVRSSADGSDPTAHAGRELTLGEQVDVIRRQLGLTGTLMEVLHQAAAQLCIEVTQGVPLADLASMCLDTMGGSDAGLYDDGSFSGGGSLLDGEFDEAANAAAFAEAVVAFRAGDHDR